MTRLLGAMQAFRLQAKSDRVSLPYFFNLVAVVAAWMTS
jgi:hypothetical protein